MALDVYPQWFNLQPVTESSAGTFTEGAANPTPVDPGRNLAMEILAVEFRKSRQTYTTQATAGLQRDYQITTKSQTAIVGIQDTSVISLDSDSREVLCMEATETGSVGTVIEEHVLRNYAMGGKGFLSAAPNFYMGLQTDGSFAQVGAVGARILYRLVKLNQAEMFGLLQQHLS